MIKRIFKFILFLILLILIIGILIVGKYIFKVFFEESPDQIVSQSNNAFSEEPDKENDKTIEGTSASISELFQDSEERKNLDGISENIKNNFFYNQLNNTQKLIYEGLMKNKQYLKQGNYVVKFGDIFTDFISQEGGSEKLGEEYQAAIEAFTHDNVDMFYLDISKMYLNIETITKFLKTSYNVYISAAKDSNYFSEDFQSTEEIEKGIIEIEEETKAILSHLNGTDYQNILYLHDYLVDNIKYDSTYERIGTYSIYGALIEKKCVCEGYAKAFKYLANSAGYECELLEGVATNSSGESEYHAWNCIKLNDNWYEIDVTWDDPIIIGGNGKASNEHKYRYYLKGSRTFEKDHTFEFQFSENGKIFSYPEISENDF